MNKIKIKNYFDFLWAMTEKEIKARYKHTVFGFLWVILNPIFQMIVIGFIFSFFIRLPVENYYLFLFSGLLPWQFFSLSLTKATPSLVYERQLLQKSSFPREVIPVSIILSNFINFVVSLSILVIFLMLTKNFIFPQILYLIPASILLLLFTIGLSLLTSTLQVKYRDINFFNQSMLILWFYATPVIYNLSLIPQNFRFLHYLNPLTYIFELFHFAIFDLSFPPCGLIALNNLIVFIVILVGFIFYRREHRFFVDWL
jgi:ABC-2 type transport system permease protein